MREFLHGVGSVWLKGVDARRYGWMRVAYGLVVLVNIFHLWSYRIPLLSSAGLIGEETAIKTNPGIYWSVFSWFDSPFMVSAVFVVAAAAAMMLVLGIWERVALILVYVFIVSAAHRSPISTTGWDFVLGNFGFILLFSPLAGNWGLARLWRGRTTRLGTDESELLPRYGLVLMQVQVAIIYWQTVFERWDDPFWKDGEFLAYFLLSHHGRFVGPWVLDWLELLEMLTHVTILLELALPFFLWFPKTRALGVVSGVVFHVGIALVSVNIAMFSLTMLMTYVAFLGGRRVRSEESELD